MITVSHTPYHHLLSRYTQINRQHGTRDQVQLISSNIAGPVPTLRWDWSGLVSVYHCGHVLPDITLSSPPPLSPDIEILTRPRSLPLTFWLILRPTHFIFTWKCCPQFSPTPKSSYCSMYSSPAEKCIQTFSFIYIILQVWREFPFWTSHFN